MQRGKRHTYHLDHIRRCKNYYHTFRRQRADRTYHTNRNNGYNYCRTKLYVIRPSILTAIPLNFVGVNLARNAASLAAACNIGCPDGIAEITLPSSLTTILTVTEP